jgi:hypothetical protein
MKEQRILLHWEIRQLRVGVTKGFFLLLFFLMSITSKAKVLFLESSNNFSINSSVLYSGTKKCKIFNINSKNEFLYATEYITPFVVIKFFYGGLNSNEQISMNPKAGGIDINTLIKENVLPALYENQFINVRNFNIKSSNKTFEIGIDTIYYKTENSLEEYIGLFVYEYYQIQCYKPDTKFQTTNSVINKCAMVNELSEYSDIDSTPVKVDGELIKENKIFLIQKHENEFVFFQYSYATPQGYQKFWYQQSIGIISFKTKYFLYSNPSNANHTKEKVHLSDEYYFFTNKQE